MRIPISFLFLIAAGLFLASCQTLSKEECVAADWRVIGEQDGSDGHDPQKRFASHAKACERAGIIPDQTAWNEGYQIGLPRFCTPLRGLAHGQAGQVYNNVCPPAFESDFQRGYQLGLKESRKKSEIRGLENNIRRAEADIDRIDEEISKGKIKEREGERDIRRLRDDIRSWNREIGRMEADLGAIEREIDYFRNDPLNSGRASY